MVVVIFGWTGGKLLVGTSYNDAKEKAAEMKASRGKDEGLLDGAEGDAAADEGAPAA